MKRFIVTENQLNEYVNIRKAENVFYDIIFDLYKNKKYLKENVSLDKANQNIIEKYKKKNLINEKVNNLLIKHGLINNRTELI